MRIWKSLVCLGMSCICALSALSAQAQLPEVSVAGIELALKRFVREPHPMGSAAQKRYASELKKQLTQFGWQVQGQKFDAKVPNLAALQLGGKDKKAELVTEVQGENIIAISQGRESCLWLIGGHYDTKAYSNFRFVGANDGGSSTALMLELARSISQMRKHNSERSSGGRFIDCSIGLVFFDGEEAFLPEWTDGERLLGLKDNTYGSRVFAASLVKGFAGLSFQGLLVKGALIIDMIGHVQQDLMISQGSHLPWAQKLLNQKQQGQAVKIQIKRQPMEDDHVPLMQKGLPVIHVIDWSNIGEWHTEKDTLAIISSQNIANFGGLILSFLNQAY